LQSLAILPSVAVTASLVSPASFLSAVRVFSASALVGFLAFVLVVVSALRALLSSVIQSACIAVHLVAASQPGDVLSVLQAAASLVTASP
jgi:hypothetical protein